MLPEAPQVGIFAEMESPDNEAPGSQDPGSPAAGAADRDRADPRPWKVWCAYLAVCLSWGSTYLALRIAVRHYPPELFAGIRFLISGALILGIALAARNRLPRGWRDWSSLGVSGLLMLTGGHGLVIWALQWVHSGITSLLLATSPLFIAAIDSVLHRSSHLGMLGWSGLLVSFAGIALLVPEGSAIGSIDAAGAAFLLLASFSFALGSVYSKRRAASGSVLAHVAVQMLAGGAGLLLAGFALGEGPMPAFDRAALGALVYLIVVGSVIGYVGYAYALRHWPASRAGTYSYVNTAVAVVLGAWFLDEPVTALTIAAMTLILGGVVLVQFARAPSRLAPVSPANPPATP